MTLIKVDDAQSDEEMAEASIRAPAMDETEAKSAARERYKASQIAATLAAAERKLSALAGAIREVSLDNTPQ